MFLVLYPIDNEMKLERHSFDWVCSKEDALEAVKQLKECEGTHFYDLSTTSYHSHFLTLEEFVEDCNNQDIDIDGYWMVHLDLSEQDVLNAIN